MLMVVFHCKCGKKLQVKEEMAGKKVKCPSCAEVAQVPQAVPHKLDLMPLDDEPKKQSGPGGSPSIAAGAGICPGCQNRVAESEVVCPKCGTMLKEMSKTQGRIVQEEEEVMTPAKRLRAYIPIAIGIIILLLAYLMLPTREEDTSGKRPKPKPQKKTAKTTKKPDSEEQAVKPEENLRTEIRNGNVMMLDEMVTMLATLQDKSLGVLAAEIKKPDAEVKLKAAYGLYFFSYFKCYRKEIFKVLDSNTSTKPADDKTRLLVLEMIYLAQTDEPQLPLVSLNDIVAPHMAKFAGVPTQPPVAQGTAKMLIQKYISDKNDLIKTKALTYLVLLGDKFQVKTLFLVLKSSDAEAVSFARSALLDFTGQSFEKLEEWDAWYKDNKDKIQFDKK